ncbi:hypothetical protein PLICRDRAFT_160809 [Plicaturopsis crispa FD-325 SS-3]|nr:hypothetical protein PLICRDRAFT_160809 [Plicaturopsis crispa FD-325 SS-3]
MSVFNPRILDASVRDVTALLSDTQKADVLLNAVEHLQHNVSRAVIENAVQSCLQIRALAPKCVARARVIRAKARLASGIQSGVQEDLNAALQAEPDNSAAKALSQRRTPENVGGALASHIANTFARSSPSTSFSTELWREIALYLPRRDLLSLLWVPHVLSRIASQLLFRTINLHFSAWVPTDEDVEGESWSSDGHAAARAADTPHSLRSADILTHMIVDPGFSSLVRTLRIHAVTRDSGAMSFQIGMLGNVLPKLKNLKNVHCSANYDDLLPIMHLVRRSCPKLQGLSLKSSENPGELELPEFKYLKHFSYRGTGNDMLPIQNILSQSRNTLQRIALHNRSWTLSTDMAIRNLTHLDVSAQVPSDSQAFATILENGHQLQYLRIHCVLRCEASAQFKAHLHALPFLRHFSFSVMSIHRLVQDPELFLAVAEFLRGRSRLRGLQLTVCDSETVQRSVGFDHGVWGLLPTLPDLQTLSITYPRGLAPGLACWLIPRTVTSLGFDCLKIPSREPVSFLNQLRAGLPPGLRYVTLKSLSCSNVSEIVEEGFPMARLLRCGDQYWTITRKNDGRAELEQWPKRRVDYHATEWLEWLDCKEHHLDFSSDFWF